MRSQNIPVTFCHLDLEVLVIEKSWVDITAKNALCCNRITEQWSSYLTSTHKGFCQMERIIWALATFISDFQSTTCCSRPSHAPLGLCYPSCTPARRTAEYLPM